MQRNDGQASAIEHPTSDSLAVRPQGKAESPELWGGIECTVNRVGDNYFDQLSWNNHCSRTEDIPRFAALGIKKLRYPVLWESHGRGEADWQLTAERLELIRSCGIEPIVGLVHHGSGPRHTSLLDRTFVAGLAEHAREVARRFPWVKYYTPVNEPLTTARFSCLYGHWYPHLRDAKAFIRALLVQLEATRAAMAAIREINPGAQLVQTEDIGKTYSTARISYQAEFDNHRRWLSFDLLTGRVDDAHPLWGYLCYVGFEPDELLELKREPCPPDVFGVNYYVTSERFLDERIENFPEGLRGGNGRDRYADVCAVRVSRAGILGHYGILKEVWERFRAPLAVTEVHLGCTREEQVRWLLEAWNAAVKLREESVDVRAITAWALLGTFDWDSLLTRSAGNYEPGVFDVRNPRFPRETALAKCMVSLSRTGRYEHPIIQTPGWWRRSERLIYPEAEPAQPGVAPLAPVFPAKRRPVLVTGARGTLGQAFKRICEQRGLEYLAATREQVDITDREGVMRALREIQPWAVINCAGYVRVDDAEKDAERCFRENALGPKNLAEACRELRIPLVTFSSDLVFDGLAGKPYLESNAINPLNVYGRSKAAAEVGVLTIWPDSLIVRTSAFFGPWDRYNFVTQTLERVRQGEPVIVADDYHVSPTYVPDLANACLDLLIDGERGVWHVANSGEITWADFARRTLNAAGLSDRLVVPKPLKELDYAAPRPAYSVLGSERTELLPDLDEALRRCLAAA